MIYAVTNTGALKWVFRSEGAITSSPTVSSDGLTLYFGSDDCHLYSLSNTGILKWRYYTENSLSSSAALFKGVLYIGSNSFDLRKKETVRGKSGKRRYSARRLSGRSGDRHREMNRTLSTTKIPVVKATKTPKLSNNVSTNSISNNNNNNNLNININVNNSVSTFGPIPPIEYGYLFAVSVQGELMWRFRVPKGTSSSPLIGADGAVYIGDSPLHVRS